MSAEAVELQRKREKLEKHLQELGTVAVAFSSGVDSTFLLKIAHDVLGDKAIAITVLSSLFPAWEETEAKAFCTQEGIQQIVLDFDALTVAGFAENPPNRCYLCKRELFGKIIRTAKDAGISAVVDGSNTDDVGDYRPGMIALAELDVKSPLRDSGLSKVDIRQLSKELGLPTWDKPSFACLASRFPYGETITNEKLHMVETAEQKILKLGIRQVRVRIHGDIARIEIDPSDFSTILKPNVAKTLNEQLQAHGFSHAALDLGGYVMGNMNKGLNS